MRDTASIVRPQTGRDSHRVTFVELFFDLVFVFVITQLSQALIEHPSLPVLLQTLLLTVALWWMWVNTAWVTNWLHPEHPAVRSLLLLMMFAALLLGTAIPDAFGDQALLFAVCYVTIEVGRSTFAILALRRAQPENSRSFVRITSWNLAAGVLWIAGALAPDARGWLWLAAVALYSIGPSARYVVPGLGATPVRVWHISGEHMAERAALFLIIVLGESIIVTGSAFDDVPLDLTSFSAFAAAFASTVLMWLLYFNHRERRGAQYIASADENGSIGRLAYTYIHVLLVIGILLTAVADELVLLHPLGEHESGHEAASSSPWVAGLICGAAAVYLIGNALFTWAVKGPILISHYLGAVALTGVFLLHPLLSPLALNWVSNVVLLAVVVLDQLLWRRLGREGHLHEVEQADETI